MVNSTPASAAPSAGGLAETRKSSPRLFTFTANDSYSGCFNAALREVGVEVFDADWSGRWLAARVRRGDVLQLHWPSFLYTAPGSRARTWWGLVRFTIVLILLRARGARIAWTAHNLYPHDEGRTVVHRIARRIVVWLSSWVCVHGRAAAAIVQREFHVPGSKLVLLEHGHYADFYPNSMTREQARERLGIAADTFVYLFLGLCKPYKNLENLVRSHASLADDSLLWIVGRFQSAAYRERVGSAARQSAAVKIRDAYVPSDELQIYFNACDAVVLPYREILTSGGAMLALSFGRPVVAPAMGVLPELIADDSGVLYDPRSDSGLIEAMRAVRQRRFEPAAILQRAHRFSWARSAATFAGTVLRG